MIARCMIKERKHTSLLAYLILPNYSCTSASALSKQNKNKFNIDVKTIQDISTKRAIKKI